MKKKLFSLILIMFLFIGIVGCGKKDDKNLENSKKDDSSESTNTSNDSDYSLDDDEDDNDNDEISYLDVSLYSIEDYVDNTMEIVARGSYLSSIHYLVNNKFEATYTWDFPADRVGAYIKTYTPDENNMYYVYDAKGNVVFEYNEKDYQQVELLHHGYLFIKKKTDTYNSSETTIGIYSLKDAKYIVEPSSEYTLLYLNGDEMYQLDDDRKVFFNARTGKIVRFSEYVGDEFENGYAVVFSFDSIKVFKDDGTIKTFTYDYDSTSYRAGAIKNGYAVDVYDGIDYGVFRVINLETGEVLDYSDKFHGVINNPTFTKDGYALVVFNNPGGVTYYTVINLDCEMQFEPEKVSSSNSFLSNYDADLPIISSKDIEGEKYIILSNNDNSLTQVRNLKNELVLTGEEDETFIKIVNGMVLVRKGSSVGDEYYFKDLKGNIIKFKDKTNN